MERIEQEVQEELFDNITSALKFLHAHGVTLSVPLMQEVRVLVLTQMIEREERKMRHMRDAEVMRLVYGSRA